MSIRSVLPETLQSATLLAKLIHPFNGKLELLEIGQCEPDNLHLFDTKLLCDAMFASSSLRELSIHLTSMDSLSSLESNTNLTSMHISFGMKPPIGQVVNVVKNNLALKHLDFSIFNQDDIDYVRRLKEALIRSTTLKEVKIGFTELTDRKELQVLFFQDQRFSCYDCDQELYNIMYLDCLGPISINEHMQSI